MNAKGVGKSAVRIKQRIWSLPIISGLVFGVGVALCVAIATGAMRKIEGLGDVDYPCLQSAKAIQMGVQGVTDALQSAVAEGEKSQLEAVAAKATQVRDLIDKVGELKGHNSRRTCCVPTSTPITAPRWTPRSCMLGVTQGDSTAAIQRMQNGLNALTPVLENTVTDAQQSVGASLEGSARQVRIMFVGDGERRARRDRRAGVRRPTHGRRDLEPAR